MSKLCTVTLCWKASLWFPSFRSNQCIDVYIHWSYTTIHPRNASSDNLRRFNRHVPQIYDVQRVWITNIMGFLPKLPPAVWLIWRKTALKKRSGFSGVRTIWEILISVNSFEKVFHFGNRTPASVGNVQRSRGGEERSPSAVAMATSRS